MNILEQIKKYGLSNIICISPDDIKQYLANLKKDGIIKRIDSTKAGYWEVVDENI